MGRIASETNENALRKAEKMSDNELVDLVRREDSEQYSEIIARYQGKLFAYLYRLVGDREEASDLLQDVFIKAFRNLHSYDIQRKFSSWIYRIAHNEAVNHIKRKYLKRFVPFDDLSSTRDKLDSSSTEDGADDIWERKESIMEVNDAISCLPVKYRQVLLLRYFSSKTYEEIGEILEKPVNTVGTLISRAKKKLAEELKINEKNEKH